MKSDLRAAITQIAADRGLSREIVREVLENALRAAYRRSNPVAANQNVRIDMSDEDLKVYVLRSVVEEVEDENTEISLDEARGLNPRLKLGDIYEIDTTPKD